MFVYQVDLHYHAGQERQTGASVRDYLEHARMTGRKILGITDHLSLYLGDKTPQRKLIYPFGLQGLLAYRREVEEQKNHFPEMKCFFAPEIGHREKLASIPPEVFEISDFLICEMPNVDEKKSIAKNTEVFIGRMREIHKMAEETKKSAYIAHPFRSSINYRLIKGDIEPRVANMHPKSHWSEFLRDELNSFFLFDAEEVAKASKELRIPLEINGSDYFRIRASNLYPPMQMYLAAYRLMQRQEAQFVPGSDQHSFRSRPDAPNRLGGYVPHDCFQELGIYTEDIDFLKRI